MKPINIPFDEFLRPLFDSGETVNIRIFDDKKSGTFSGLKLECEQGKLPGIEGTLRKHNAQGRGIFFVVNFGGDCDEDISRINAVFVENDNLSIEQQLAALDAFPLPPSLMVKTAKSVHAYWLVKDVRVQDFRTMQKRLVAQFDGDPACVNESRVLRLPGFNHCKGEPVMVECIKFAPELRYTKAQLDEVLPKVEAETQPTVTAAQGSRKGLTLVGKRCSFMQHCKENAAALPENLWYAMITNLAVFEGGDKAIHALSKAYPKYSRAETQEKIAHFLASETKPITCAKIAEMGFACPCAETCGCKAPAALCYKAMTTEELRKALSGIESTGVVLDDMQIARQFITEHLYNIDSVLAEAFINYELKPHFKFKAGDMRPLLSLHKELYKKYADSKETRRETEGTELPDWYEITDRGGLHFLPGVLSDHMAKNVAAFYGAGAYYFYRHGVYELDDEDAAKNVVRDFMIARQAKSNDIGDACTQWRIQIRKLVREINANPFIVNLRNGLYNVLDGTFREHSPEYYSTVQLNANYDPTAKCPQFLDFLGGILPDTELDLIQEIFGYLLIPVNKAQKAFVFVGAPNAGKSTLLSIAQEILLGAENVTNIPWQSLGDRFYKAELFGKLANVFADLPSKNIEDGGWFKALTGEDYISAERKNKDPFNYRPYARLLFSCNDIPKNYADRSDGFYRRLLIIRFDKSVPAEKRDPNLRERIAVERDGILLWALEGLKRLIANSYQFSETQRTRCEVARYRIESNSALTFVDEMCEVGDGHWIAREELYNRYRDFCTANGLKSASQTTFNKEIDNGFPAVHRGQDKLSGRKVWRGVRYIDGGKE
jgi:putative DNA primase/helicase